MVSEIYESGIIPGFREALLLRMPENTSNLLMYVVDPRRVWALSRHDWISLHHPPPCYGNERELGKNSQAIGTFSFIRKHTTLSLWPSRGRCLLSSHDNDNEANLPFSSINNLKLPCPAPPYRPSFSGISLKRKRERERNKSKNSNQMIL